MTFRRDSLLFYQSEIAYIIMITLSLCLFPILGKELMLFYLLPFIVLLLVNPKLHNEFIIINENGISCRKSGKQLWSYEWESIAELRKSSRFLMPTIEVIAYNKCGKPALFSQPNHYFQLGRTAKKAIMQYYTSTKHSSN